jgi:CheY-like chemotaxis protein
LLSLVNNVLDVTHLESGKVELKSEPFNLLDTLNSLAGIVQGEIESTSIAFKTDFKGIVHPKVQGDQTQIKRALLNFLDNAVKLTPEGKGIDFEVKEMNDSRYLFSLATSGESLSQSLLTALNSPSQTSGLESAEGGELSLRIARDLFASMGGRITARNLPDGGHEIQVSLPLKNPQEATNKKAGAYTPNLSNKRVLLVEDNAINQAIALYLLKPTSADIALAKNGQEAVDKYLASKEGAFSLILMDISMPVMDGYEATKRIRESGRKDALSTPILAMTANAFSEDAEKIFAAGMNEHLTKPIDKNLLYIALDTYKDGIPAKGPSK